MPIDPNIAFQYKGVQIPDPVNALAKTMQLQNMAQEQQANALRMKQAGLDTRQKMYMQAIGRAGNKQQAAAITEQMFADPVVGPVFSRFGTKEQAIAEIPDDPKEFGYWKLTQSGASPIDVAKLKQGEMKIAGQQEAAKATREAADAYRQANLGLQQARARYEGVLPDTLNQPVEGGAGAAGALPSPIPGLSPAQERAFKLEQLKTQFKKQQQRPQVEAAYETAIKSLDETQKDVGYLLGQPSETEQGTVYEGHPGLSSITGSMASKAAPITTFVSQDAANAQVRIDKLKARTFLAALSDLKAASKTGATGLGAVSNIEGQKVQNAYAALDQAQDTETYKKALADLNDQIEQSKKILKKAYEKETGVASGVVAPGGKRPSLSDIFKKD